MQQHRAIQFDANSSLHSTFIGRSSLGKAPPVSRIIRLVFIGSWNQLNAYSYRKEEEEAEETDKTDARYPASPVSQSASVRSEVVQPEQHAPGDLGVI